MVQWVETLATKFNSQDLYGKRIDSTQVPWHLFVLSPPLPLPPTLPFLLLSSLSNTNKQMYNIQINVKNDPTSTH